MKKATVVPIDTNVAREPVSYYTHENLRAHTSHVMLAIILVLAVLLVAPGGSVTGVDETAPLVYVKSLGPSQFDRPTLVTYKLELVPDEPVKAPEKPAAPFALQRDVIALQQRYEG